MYCSETSVRKIIPVSVYYNEASMGYTIYTCECELCILLRVLGKKTIPVGCVVYLYCNEASVGKTIHVQFVMYIIHVQHLL